MFTLCDDLVTRGNRPQVQLHIEQSKSGQWGSGEVDNHASAQYKTKFKCALTYCFNDAG